MFPRILSLPGMAGTSSCSIAWLAGLCLVDSSRDRLEVMAGSAAYCSYPSRNSI